ncbi:hypothetical protein Nham_3291 [Nitrobacter hamburgensis X14]|uniref:Uncharacterized protein n=1 Tax=Nitrobacter hamburgensis (strain DSM 10229 / NCIMB 13809 / X14) TaxID=323097 RepID=Q1QIC2_NITHX|nr:hypothetical protein Nham_3291 [Nitrobacter hamburgensis X14]
MRLKVRRGAEPHTERDEWRDGRPPSEEGESDAASGRYFTLEIDGRAVLVFSAPSLRSAKTRVRENWFVQELSQMRTGGKPLCVSESTFVVRAASLQEKSEAEVWFFLDRFRGDDVKYHFTFLVPMDAQPH